jgi:two-component system CheB/CheR fusion protein
MKNLLDSTEIITLFLDKKLNIRRYTKQIVKLFKILESDIGRPITDLASELIYTELQEDALEVLKTLKPMEKNIPTRSKSWFQMRIIPYRTYDDKVDGLVVTFIDNTQHRLAEELIKSVVADGKEEIATTHSIGAEEFKNKA